jgi:hypothetical protein
VRYIVRTSVRYVNKAQPVSPPYKSGGSLLDDPAGRLPYIVTARHFEPCERTMKSEELRKILEQLHAELASTDTIDAALRERLRALQRDIGDALGKETPPASLRGMLEDAVVHFEASHPTLARRLAAVIDTLALYGL